MADGKTVEEVAREIVEDNKPPYWLDGENVVDLSRLGGLIETALRQREQETAETCAEIAESLTVQRSDTEYSMGGEDRATEIRDAIISRFPKAEG